MSTFAHSKRRGWTTAAIVLWALVLATNAIAQPKPALVRSVDEPGRDPYQQAVVVSPAAVTCGATLTACAATFLAVPTGKRLIVTHASVVFTLSASANPRSRVSLIAPPGVTLFLPVAQEQGPSQGVYIMSSPVTFYVEAGTAPVMLLETSGANPAAQIVATLVGYYVTLP